MNTLLFLSYIILVNLFLFQNVCVNNSNDVDVFSCLSSQGKSDDASLLF